MAKEQHLPLNQSSLTGVCGRLSAVSFTSRDVPEVKGKLPKLATHSISPPCERLGGTSGLRHDPGVNVAEVGSSVGMVDGSRKV